MLLDSKNRLVAAEGSPAFDTREEAAAYFGNLDKTIADSVKLAKKECLLVAEAVISGKADIREQGKADPHPPIQISPITFREGQLLGEVEMLCKNKLKTSIYTQLVKKSTQLFLVHYASKKAPLINGVLPDVYVAKWATVLNTIYEVGLWDLGVLAAPSFVVLNPSEAIIFTFFYKLADHQGYVDAAELIKAQNDAIGYGSILQYEGDVNMDEDWSCIPDLTGKE